MGRASGGCLYGFKKDKEKLLKLKFINLSGGNVVLTASLNNNIYYLIPRYINCTNWNNDFQKLETFLLDLCPTNYCIIGDLNARIGTEQKELDPHLLLDLPHINKTRLSKDVIVNSQGMKLLDLIESIGGVVLNGRINGDSDGDLTFHGGRGNSVIDYCICSYSFLTMVDNFKISCKPYSDHMPLDLKIRIPITNQSSPKHSVSQQLRWKKNNITNYTYNLNQFCSLTTIDLSKPVDELILDIKGKITNAAVKNTHKFNFEPKQKWFNWKCARYRKKMLRKLKVYRKTHLNANKLKYMSSKRKYIEACRKSKLDYYNSNLEKLNTVSCSKQWWKLSNDLKSRSFTIRGNLSSEDFLQHFSSIFKSTDPTTTIQWCLPCNIDPFLDSPFELCELVSVLKCLKDNKSPGQDGICYEFFKYAPPVFINELLSVLNTIFLKENIPSSFKTSILIPLLKKGDPNCPSNYRGLSLMDSICKIFNNIILNRITDWINKYNILNEYQAGFRKQYSTIDNIFNLSNIIHLNNIDGKNTYAFFVDFSCAFDSIPRNSLFYKLSTIGLSSKIIRILIKSYENTTSKISFGTTSSEAFNVDLGVKQGCSLSPLLFSLYLNDLPDALPGGVKCGNITVKILLYADDIVLLSDSATGLQNMIDSLHEYCNAWQLKVNLSKSKVVVFRSGTRISNNLVWTYGVNQIEIVNSYKYLGMELSYNLSFRKHLENKLLTSKMAISSSWSKYINHPKITNKNKIKIFQAASRSIMFYGAQIWGFKKYEAVEKLLRFFIKKMLYLPSNTPNYMLLLETGLNSLFLDTLKLHFNYINKVLSLPANRLPRQLAELIITRQTFWAEEWSNLCAKINFIPNDTSVPLSKHSNSIISLLKSHENEKLISDAKDSQFHDLYSQLNYFLVDISSSDLPSHVLSLLIKARGGLLNINSRAFRSNTVGICTICNLDATENTFHVIGKCPIYSGLRLKFFNKSELCLSDVLNILNGQSAHLTSLYSFLTACLKYRNLIINEFA